MKAKPTNTFATLAPDYWRKPISVIPIRSGSKQPAISGWQGYNQQLASHKRREEWLTKHPDCGIGLCPGTELSDGIFIGAIDIDDDRLTPMVESLLGNVPSAKFGAKGKTIFVRFPKGLKSKKLGPKGKKAQVELFLTSGMVVLPPSRHPDTGQEYVWLGETLLETDLLSLPLLTNDKYNLLVALVGKDPTEVMLSGEGTHGAALKLTGLTWRFLESDQLCDILAALLPPNYQGNTTNELPEMIASAAKKHLGVKPVYGPYDPGATGPVPLGCLSDGRFVLRDGLLDRIAGYSSSALTNEGGLLGLAPKAFWEELYPSGRGFNPKAAGDGVMQACRTKGPFNVSRIHGRGVWREGEQIVVNLGGEIPTGLKDQYVCFERLPDLVEQAPSGADVLRIFSHFNWAHEDDAVLLLGWVQMASICGALNWRPHIFIAGAKNTGKTTLVRGIKGLLSPLAVVLDGQSTEAGIRQRLGADSLPVVLDEFESDHDRRQLQRVIKLARSASSAEGRVARGTPEGKALEFSIRTTFCFAAINPIGGSAADASRIVVLELEPHSNGQSDKQAVEEGIAELEASEGGWCRQAIAQVENVVSSIPVFSKVMPPIDSRHALNMSTLFSAAFTALNQRAVSEDEARDWINRYSGLIERHGVAHEEDDAKACLYHLLGSPCEDMVIGPMVKGALNGDNYPRLLRLGIRADGDKHIYIANSHPGLDVVYANTKWQSGGWKTALARLEGAEKTEPIRFGDGTKPRAVRLPAYYFTAGDYEEYLKGPF